MKELELYIHIPYCIRKCKYCDFLSFADKSEEDKKEYFQKLNASIRGENTRTEYRVRSIFFGGGTPSSVSAEYIIDVMKRIRDEFEVESDAEITIEANPGTMTDEKLEAYIESGINRISIGIQSLDNGLLKTMGRIHTAEEAEAAFLLARKAGFKNISTDLILGYPTQTADMFKETLERIIELGPEHISAYSLIDEEGTPLNKQLASGELKLPAEEEERAMYHTARRMLKDAGYMQYEISSFAKPGRECRHNIGYWTGVPYIGYGIGAASFFDNKRYTIGENFLPREEEVIDTEEAKKEFMMLGFRMTAGPDNAEYQRRFGEKYEERFAAELKRLESKGLVEKDDARFIVTEKGLDFANEIFREFV